MGVKKNKTVTTGNSSNNNVALNSDVQKSDILINIKEMLQHRQDDQPVELLTTAQVSNTSEFNAP